MLVPLRGVAATSMAARAGQTSLLWCHCRVSLRSALELGCWCRCKMPGVAKCHGSVRDLGSMLA